MTNQELNTPEAVEAAYYAAFAATDVAAMAAVWVQGDKASCIHPGGGLRHGKAAVMQSWIEIFSGSEPPTIEYRLIDSFESAGLVARLVEEQIRPRGEPASAATRVLAMNLYLRERGSWRLVAHHASLPLVSARGSGEGGPSLH